MPRVKRPVPERQAPIRSWASAMNADAHQQRDPAAATSGTPPNSDPIVRGVVSGNRVVEDWIRQAQHTARLLGGNAGTSGWADASGRMMKTASDAFTAWSTLLGMSGPNGAGTRNEPPPPNGGRRADGDTATPHADVPHEAPAPARTAASSRLTVDLTSTRPVTVTVDLTRDTVAPLRVLDLRPERGHARRIRGAELSATREEGLRLRLAVPDNQPPGTYHAVVVDNAADCAVGTITVRIA